MIHPVCRRVRPGIISWEIDRYFHERTSTAFWGGEEQNGTRHARTIQNPPITLADPIKDDEAVDGVHHHMSNLFIVSAHRTKVSSAGRGEWQGTNAARGHGAIQRERVAQRARASGSHPTRHAIRTCRCCRTCFMSTAPRPTLRRPLARVLLRRPLLTAHAVLVRVNVMAVMPVHRQATDF